jgi:hypothetical protein
MEMKYRLLRTKSASLCDDEKEWSRWVRENCTCPGCGAFKREWRTKPMDVHLAYKPDGSAINVTSAGLGVIRSGFMALFEAEMRPQFFFGKVFDRKGNAIDGYETFIGRKPLAVRAGPESERRHCDVCNRFVYIPLGDEYLLRSSLSSQPIYGDPAAHLVVSEALYARIDRKVWKGFYVTKLPVRDEPLDGIDEFPDNYY